MSKTETQFLIVVRTSSSFWFARKANEMDAVTGEKKGRKKREKKK